MSPGEISMGASHNYPHVAPPMSGKKPPAPTSARQMETIPMPESEDMSDEDADSETIDIMPIAMDSDTDVGADMNTTSTNGTTAAEPPVQSHVQRRCTDRSQCSFYEDFSRRRDERWTAADGYANGNPFDSWWSRARVLIDVSSRKMRLSLTRQANFGKPFMSGQLQSKKWHGYGCYEVRMKPVHQAGLITTFFTYTGFYDAAPGASKQHNEIDIEFIERHRTGQFVMQTNYFTNGRGQNEHYIRLPFNAAAAYHNYGFRWTNRSIEWYVDGRKVHSEFNNVPKASVAPHKIMMNYWPVSSVAAGWAGYFRFVPGKVSSYAGIRFTRGSNCVMRNSFPNA